MSDDWDAMAAGAIAAWGGAPAGLRLVKARENVVFRAELPGGPVALRLHRPGYQSAAAIRSELIWTGMLADRGLPVPAPVPTLSGELVHPRGDRLASCVAWLDGDPLGAAETPLAGDRETWRGRMVRVGRLLADLHATSDGLALPEGFVRPSWDTDGLLGPDPLWGPFWQNPAFSPADRRIISEARAHAVSRLDTLAAAGADYGLIHADVLRENLLDDGTRLAVIDFDDSGFGFRLLDLATAIVQSLEEPMLPVLVEGLCEGYGSRDGFVQPLPQDLALFVMLRTFASAGWIATRAAADDPRQAFDAGRAVRMARHVLRGTLPWTASRSARFGPVCGSGDA